MGYVICIPIYVLWFKKYKCCLSILLENIVVQNVNTYYYIGDKESNLTKSRIFKISTRCITGMGFVLVFINVVNHHYNQMHCCVSVFYLINRRTVDGCYLNTEILKHCCVGMRHAHIYWDIVVSFMKICIS